MHLTLRFPSLMQQVSARAVFYMLLSALCFALVEVLGARFIQDVSLYQLVWGRYAIHLLFMLVILGPRYKTTLVRTPHLKLQIIRSLTMLAMPLSFIAASASMSANNIWSVYWLSPLMMLGLSVSVLHESVGSIRWIAALVGFGGMLLIYHPDAGIFSLAVLPALVMGFAISLHLTLSRILRDDHPLTSLFHTALWVFATLSFLMPFVWQAPTLSDLVAIVVVGLIGMVTLFFLARSGETAPVPIVASFAYSEGIWTIVLQALVFGIMPHKSTLLGALVVAAVTVFLFFHEVRQPAPGTTEHPSAKPVDNRV
jgi:drug/metabolite transporter (DMT)-like permease